MYGQYVHSRRTKVKSSTSPIYLPILRKRAKGETNMNNRLSKNRGEKYFMNYKNNS